MLHWLLTIRIDHLSFLVPLYAIAALLAAYLLVRSPWPLGLVRTVVAGLVGAAAALFACWLFGDVWNVFGIDLTATTRMWVALACAGIGLAVANLWGSRWYRLVIACVSIPVFLLAGAAGVNMDFGAFRNVSEVVQSTPYRSMPTARLHGTAGVMPQGLLASWRADAPLPAHGKIGTVHIPATASHFRARDAVIYLPPAALVPNAPKLPVIVAFPGQPGTPAYMFTSGRMGAILDAYAAQHHGLAPIVVAPDQLGEPDRNPMCVDSPIGNSATYLTVDVPNWIRSHLNVANTPDAWAIIGYSQGGTCSIQLGGGHPELFRTIVDISGELVPTIGADTVARGFGGSTAAYDAAKPLSILAAHTPYHDTTAIFAAGAEDTKYSGFARAVFGAATKAGMTTKLIISPGTAHDWHTVLYVFHRTLPDLASRLLGSKA